MNEDREVYPEEEQVENNWEDNQCDRARDELFPEFLLHRKSALEPPIQRQLTHHAVLPIIQNIPQIYQDGDTDCKDGKDTIDLGGPCAGHECSGCEQPCPPFARVLPAPL